MIANVVAGHIPRSSSQPRPQLHAPRDTLDEALIESVAAGDAAAMKVLYARHNVRVFRFALRLTGNEATAEEVVSEVFLDLWKAASKFEGRSQVSTWMLAIARNKAWQAMRRRPTEPLDDKVEDSVEDTSDDPETAVLKKQTGQILRNCLTNLPLAHREIVDLVYYHGKSIEEIVEITGLARNTVKTRMFYARKRLAELLNAHGIVAAAA
jgi:RNA polymerase sigma-70 factor (ECF subfamily)